MPADIPPFLLPVIALYPEIHYRFRALPFSRCFRRQPEIIADAPHRLEPGRPLPILLLIKDADRYPVTLEEVIIELHGGETRMTHKAGIDPKAIRDHWWHRIEWVELPDEAPCLWEVSVIWRVKIRGRPHIFITDNLPGLSHKPLQVQQSGHSLPRKEGWHFGDLHAHCAYTEDQVEFGAPLAAYPSMGRAIGLSFMMAADHSYDLDDLPGSFTKMDPNLTRFRTRSSEIELLNNQYRGEFALLPGYELSVANARGKNVHLLLLNQRDFLPGSGDSAERWLRTGSELSLDEALISLNPDTLPVAAHPKMRPPLLQRWLLGRGLWEGEDLRNDRLFGLQVWNGTKSEDFWEGTECWVDGLLSGKRWRALAGSDAHGNFNRYRQVGFPMWTLAEAEGQIFGEVRTGVHLKEKLSAEGIVQALTSEPSLISDGPFAEVELRFRSDGSSEAVIEALSTPEFGAISAVRLYWGKEGETNERILIEENFQGRYQAKLRIDIPEPSGYVRSEIRTDAGRFCLTNPRFVSAGTP